MREKSRDVAMKIQWYAHACFRIETEGRSIVTDPYTPHKSGFRPITEAPHLVVRSSDDDSAHANAAMFPGADVMTMTYAPAEGTVWRGMRFTPIPAQESMLHKLEPKDNALYRFVADGVDVVHFGDVGNPLEAWQLDLMRGCDVVLVPTGGPPTIELPDLHAALVELRPRVTIPMHYALPGCLFPTMLDVAEFTQPYAAGAVRHFNAPALEILPADLPAEPEVWVMTATHTAVDPA